MDKLSKRKTIVYSTISTLENLCQKIYSLKHFLSQTAHLVHSLTSASPNKILELIFIIQKGELFDKSRFKSIINSNSFNFNLHLFNQYTHEQNFPYEHNHIIFTNGTVLVVCSNQTKFNEKKKKTMWRILNFNTFSNSRYRMFRKKIMLILPSIKRKGV